MYMYQSELTKKVRISRNPPTLLLNIQSLKMESVIRNQNHQFTRN